MVPLGRIPRFPLRLMYFPDARRKFHDLEPNAKTARLAQARASKTGETDPPAACTRCPHGLATEGRHAGYREPSRSALRAAPSPHRESSH